MKRLALVLIFALTLTGCATYFTDVKIRKQESMLYVGMPYSEVVKIVGREPNTGYDTIRRGVDKEGEWLTWVVGQSSVFRSDSNLTTTYTFKFRNNRLAEWWSR